MSWNNVIPAWALCPVRLRYNGNNWKGFQTRQEAEWFIRMEGDHVHDYTILEEDENSS